MPIVRVKKRKGNPYVIIDRRTMSDTKLSWKARGLLAYLLTKPNKWRVNVLHLIEQAPDGKHAVKAALKELRDCGYLELATMRDKKGRVKGTEYVVLEVPTERPKTGSSVEPIEETNNTPLEAFTERPKTGSSASAHRETEKPRVGKSAPIVNKESIVIKDSINQSTPPIPPPSGNTLIEKYGPELWVHPAVVAYYQTFPHLETRIRQQHREMMALKVGDDSSDLETWQTILDRWAGTIGWRPEKVHNLIDAFEREKYDGTTSETRTAGSQRNGRHVHERQPAGEHRGTGATRNGRVESVAELARKRPGELSKAEWLRLGEFEIEQEGNRPPEDDRRRIASG